MTVLWPTANQSVTTLFCLDWQLFGYLTGLFRVVAGGRSGPDGKKLKTRSGETTKLSDLLDTAVFCANASMVKRSVLEPGEHAQSLASTCCMFWDFSLSTRCVASPSLLSIKQVQRRAGCEKQCGPGCGSMHLAI